MSIDQSSVPPASKSSEVLPPYEEELARIDARREALGVPARAGEGGRWGLALSGGGIRSATFSLGVLQGLSLAGRAARSKQFDEPVPDSCLLEQFDYLSTVSGGGYIGGFFGSLFVPGRLRPAGQGGPHGDKASVDAALNAYEVLRLDPPGRIRCSEDYQAPGQPPGAGPLAWLRENGRYMMPSGAGDIMYAAALGIRNWLALHYVLGSLLLMLFAGMTLLRVLILYWAASHEGCLIWLFDWIASWERATFPSLKTPFAHLWLSPLWILTLAIVYGAVLPVAVGFWLVQRQCSSVEMRPSRFSPAAILALLLSLLTFWLAVQLRAAGDEWRSISWSLMALTVPVALGGVLSIFLSWLWYHSATISVLRVRLTRMLAKTFEAVAIFAVLALLDTLAQLFYWWAMCASQGAIALPIQLGGVLGALVWLVRAGSKLLDEKEKPGWMRFVPISSFATLGGVAMLLLVAMVWGMAAQWLRWLGRIPSEEMLSAPEAVLATTALCGFAVLQAFLLAQFPGFLNLSSLQSIYSARLTRAYLGASNGDRFGSDRSVGVSEPLPSDTLTVDRYHKEDVLAPVHLVNVTVNLTVDPAEQLVQRDRKGKPLVVGSANWFSVDGEFYRFDQVSGCAEIRQPLSLGQWIGVSGAAFTTGLGRTTSLGFSLLLGLANVRLGAWWESGIKPTEKGGRLLSNLFRTQSCLKQELFAEFHGLRRKWHYLSDGGHFENTGAYELLRKERDNRLIVICDNGCDPSYHFDDLANLIRLARIDLNVELAADTVITKHDTLGQVFGTREELADTARGDDKCALLLNVFRAGAGTHKHDTPICCIVVLKPRLIASAPLDVHQYQQQQANDSFPQETTFDQSFDEAQWESYRRLGISIARRVFGRHDENTDMTEILLDYLFDRNGNLKKLSARRTG